MIENENSYRGCLQVASDLPDNDCVLLDVTRGGEDDTGDVTGLAVVGGNVKMVVSLDALFPSWLETVDALKIPINALHWL